MNQWHEILLEVLEDGVMRPDRTGVGTYSLFGKQLTFDLREGFPAVTSKKLQYGQVVAELAAFLHGEQTIEGFHKWGCKIWDGNIGADYWVQKARWPGDAGRIYGVQWRDWQSHNGGGGIIHVDQLAELVDGMRRDPYGRRHLVTAWNPGELDQMCLPPCHVLFQAYLSPSAAVLADGLPTWLDLRVDMRSVDLFLGLPFDVASYATLQHLLAKELRVNPRHLVFQLGDAHIYLNHQDAVREVLGNDKHALPRLELHKRASLLDFRPEHAWLTDYNHSGVVSAPLNV